MNDIHFTWGYHSSDEQHVHVAFVDETGARDDLFDVTLYDPDVIEDSGRTAMEESLLKLRELLGLANAALKAGLEPEPVADRID